MVEANSKIRIQGVRKQFGSKVVLDAFNLDIAKGESMVVIGGSGVGKSVMLKCLLGILTPDSGSIKIDGEEIIGMNAGGRSRINDRIGMLFQMAALFDSQPIWENVAFGLLARGIPRAEAKEIALAKLALTGLGSEVLDLYPNSLSAGMRKRAGLARAIATNPDIIFFDEPTTGLDPIMGDIINDLILHCVKETGATTMTITHDMQSARKISDKIAMMYNGNIIWVGTTEDIDKSSNEYVQQFIHGHIDGPIKATAQV
ncbi:MAG: ABC transporter ATP-binding protein [Rhodospirillales bacterium]|jgi:phospholipid/cholesterol/gamma-HCH transport system ATP-binding protein